MVVVVIGDCGAVHHRLSPPADMGCNFCCRWWWWWSAKSDPKSTPAPHSAFCPQAMSMCTTIRARIMIAAIFFAALVARLPNFLDMRLVHKQLYDDNNGTYTKLVMEWRGDLYNNAVYSFIVPGFLAGLLPLVALAALNICLVVEIRKSTRYLR